MQLTDFIGVPIQLNQCRQGASFVFDLRFQNLSQMELGALIYLLDLPGEHFHRFGGGKPLGFGSVRLSIEEHEIHFPDTLRERYAAWHTPASVSVLLPETAREAFLEALRRAYPGESGHADPAFLRAFLRACQGFEDGRPLHYPRATPDGQPRPPSPDGESFKWFVENEKTNKSALPDLTNDRGLPTMKTDPKNR